MRSLLTVLIVLFTMASCFAMKPGGNEVQLFSGKTLKAAKIHFSQLPDEEESNLNKDEFEHHHFIQQTIKKQAIASIQLFDRPAFQLIQDLIVRNYTTGAALSYNYIYYLLYPKHFFW